VGNGVDHQLGDTPVDTAFLSRLEERLGLSLTCKKILLAIGRPVERKGFSWFLEEVLPRLEEDVVFILIGPQQKYFRPIRWLYRLLPRQLARSFVLMLGVSMDEPKVHAVLGTDACKGKGFWLSDLPHSEVVQLLKVADLFVMPNKKVDGDVEGFGLVVLEATICATPVVASGIEGITDAVKDGENGFLLPSEDADAWVEKLTELLANRQALKRFGQQAQQYTRQHYGWDRMVDGYLAVFRRYIEKA
jgi:phosphatidylinositol alpha-1,6-mannosyltransferase